MLEQNKSNTGDISGFLLDLTIALRKNKIRPSQIEIIITTSGETCQEGLCMIDLYNYAKESGATLTRDGEKGFTAKFEMEVKADE